MLRPIKNERDRLKKCLQSKLYSKLAITCCNLLEFAMQLVIILLIFTIQLVMWLANIC